MNKKFIKLSLATVFLLCGINSFGANTNLGTGNTFTTYYYGTSDLNNVDSTSDNNNLYTSTANSLINSDSLIFKYSNVNFIYNLTTGKFYNSDINTLNLLAGSSNVNMYASNFSDIQNKKLNSVNFYAVNNIVMNGGGAISNSYFSGSDISFTTGGTYSDIAIFGNKITVDAMGSATGSDLTIIGQDIHTQTDKTTVIGSDITTAYGQTKNILAVGDNITVGTVSGSTTGKDILAFGRGIQANDGMSFGFDGTNSGSNSVVFFSDTIKTNTDSNVFNIGERRVTNMSDPVNATDGATKGYVDTKVASVSFDSSNYYDKTNVDTKISSGVSTANTYTDTQLVNYYDKTTADSKYSLKSNTYTKSEVDTLVSSGSADLTPYSTTIQMNTAISDYSYSKSYVDTNYYTKTQAENYVNSFTYSQGILDTKFSDTLTNANSFTTTKLLDYYTKTQADTTFSTKADTYTKSEVDTKISTVSASGSVDLTPYSTTAQMNTAISDYSYSKSYVDTNYWTASATQSYLATNYYTKGEVDSLNLSGSVDLSGYYSKAQVDSILTTNYATKTDLAAVSSGGSGSVSVADKADIVNTANAYTDTAKAEAISSSNSYTDTSVASAKTELRGEIDTAKQEVLNQARGYTDQKFAEADKRAKQYSSLASALSSPLDYSRGNNAFNASVTNVAGMTAVGVSVGKKMPNDVYYNVSVGSTGTYHGAKATVGYSW